MSNEITVKVKCSIEELSVILGNKGFETKSIFSLDDIFLIPENLDISKMSTRDILKHAVLIREVNRKLVNKIERKIIFKKKQIDNKGNILNQESISCKIQDREDAKRLLKAIGYKEIMQVIEEDIEYIKDGFSMLCKDVIGGDNLIEVDVDEKNPKLDTIEKLVEKLNELQIPIYTDNYFVKKAEIELYKILHK